MSLQSADNWFSKYIRLRDSVNGKVKCFICCRMIDFSEATAGHFIKRRHMATRFDEDNVHALCKGCNGRDETDETTQYLHECHMIVKYGKARVDNLKLKARQPFRMNKSYLKDIASEYRNKVRELK